MFLISFTCKRFTPIVVLRTLAMRLAETETSSKAYTSSSNSMSNCPEA